MLALFFIVLGWSVYSEYRETRQRTEDRALAASQVVATNALWITEMSRQALGRIDAALGPNLKDKARETADQIREAVERLPGNVKAYVVAADGETLFSTDPKLKPIDIRDREYFAALARGARFHASSLLVSRLDEAQIFVFSRRLEREGQFAGAAIISFDVILFKDIWTALALDSQSTVSLIREDGHLTARYPLADGPLDLSQYVLFTDYLKHADTGVYPAHSPADGVDRIVAYRRVAGTPFIALASLSIEGAFSQFWRKSTATLGIGLPLGLALFAAMIWIRRLVRNVEHQRLQLMEAVDLNQMLVRDTHHRVKNNLQAIVSMVRMHDLPEGIKSDLQSRISAMAAVHQHLYRLDQVSEIDAPTLIPGVVNPLRHSFDREVDITYDIDPVIIDRDSATPLALLISEVVTNALKYAHAPGDPGRLAISLKQAGPDILLTIRDNGKGFDPETAQQGLGTRLIQAMTMQLNGTSGYSFDDGTVFEARLRLGSAGEG